MNSLWKITIDGYLEIVARAKKAGLKPGDSMEEIFKQYAKEKKLKPFANTELNKAELLKEYTSHGKNILEGSTDKEGKTIFKAHKGLDNHK